LCAKFTSVIAVRCSATEPIAASTGIIKIDMPLSAPKDIARYTKNISTDKKEVHDAVIKRTENKFLLLHLITNTIQKIKIPGNENKAEQINIKPMPSQNPPLLPKAKINTNSKALIRMEIIHTDRLTSDVARYLFDVRNILLIILLIN
jgi:hypothetical protein